MEDVSSCTQLHWLDRPISTDRCSGNIWVDVGKIHPFFRTLVKRKESSLSLYLDRIGSDLDFEIQIFFLAYLGYIDFQQQRSLLWFWIYAATNVWPVSCHLYRYLCGLNINETCLITSLWSFESLGSLSFDHWICITILGSSAICPLLLGIKLLGLESWMFMVWCNCSST